MMMEDIAMHVLDIGMNSLRANAAHVSIVLEESAASHCYRLTIADDGCGMDEEQLKKIIDPFYTTRTTRRIGLGIPFLKAAAELSGGSFAIESTPNIGTTLYVHFDSSHWDCPPLGNIAEAVVNLMTYDESIQLTFAYICDNARFDVDTTSLQQELDGVSLAEPSIMCWLKEYIKQQMDETKLKEEEKK